MPAKPFDPKVVAYVLGGSAIAIVIGIFSRSWLTHRRGGIGTLGYEECFTSRCVSHGWQGAPGDIQLVGYLTLISGLAAAIASGYMAFLVLTNTPNRFPKFKLVNIAFGVASFATTFFAIRLLIESGKQFSISWSPLFAIGGVVTAGIFIRKLRPYWPGEGNLPWPVQPRVAPGFAPGGGFAPGSGPPGGFAPASQPPGGFAPAGQPPSSQPPGGFAPSSQPPSAFAPGGPPPAFAPGAQQPPSGFAPGSQPPGGFAPPAQPPPSQPPGGFAPTAGTPGSQPPGGFAPSAHASSPGAAPLPFAATMAAPPPTGAPPLNKGTSLGAPAPHAKQPAGQFCGRCGKPMTFVAQYQRWFCEQCRQYA